MSDKKTIYYLAGEKAAALVQAYKAGVAASKKAHLDLMRSAGACGVYIGGTFDFAHDITPPTGFKRYARSKKNRGLWRFDKTPEGRALAKRYAAVPRMPQVMDLTEDLKGGGYGLPRFFQYYGFTTVADAIVITGQEGWTVPLGCTPIKASEYWLMVEAADVAAGGAR